MPYSATLDYFSAAVPDGVPSNVPTLRCLPFQYTASDHTIAPVFQATYSSNIVVMDYSFRGCMLRELVYYSPPVNSFK